MDSSPRSLRLKALVRTAIEEDDDDSEPEAEDATQAISDSKAVKCEVCSAFLGEPYNLNGPEQYKDHLTGKGHKKRVKRLARLAEQLGEQAQR